MNDRREARGRYVLYWMQQAQRVECNHALEYAIHAANSRGLPVVVVFGLTTRYPEASLRHYTFMLEGLREVRQALAERKIQLVVRRDDPDQAAVALGRSAALVVTDGGYLRPQKRWREKAAAGLSCQLIQIESDVIVPVETVSDHEEYAARTIRPKIHRLLREFIVPLKQTVVNKSSLPLKITGVDLMLDKLGLDRSVAPARHFKGGTSEARRRLKDFIRHKLAEYPDRHSEPSANFCSSLSPYLHFGQISALQIALAVRDSDAPRPAREAFLEELIIRRELSMNFVHFNPHYDRYACLPDWAKRTLARHARDKREQVYTLRELEAAQTHDPYWNAAQQEMALIGKMSNTMRMYWGKKIIEWTRAPEEAFEIALHLNNKYELDGRDANGFAGVAWCFGKHDRPWSERNIFGLVRYMNAAGLDRKYDMPAYLARVKQLSART